MTKYFKEYQICFEVDGLEDKFAKSLEDLWEIILDVYTDANEILEDDERDTYETIYDFVKSTFFYTNYTLDIEELGLSDLIDDSFNDNCYIAWTDEEIVEFYKFFS